MFLILLLPLTAQDATADFSEEERVEDFVSEEEFTEDEVSEESDEGKMIPQNFSVETTLITE